MKYLRHVWFWGKNAWTYLTQYWEQLSPEKKLAAVGLIAAVLTLFWNILTWLVAKRQLRIMRQERRERKYSQDFPLPFIPAEELTAERLGRRARVLSATEGKMEQYVPRRNVGDQLNEQLLPRSCKVLLHGPPGIGKTREAVEIILRLANLAPRNVYFSQRALPSFDSLPLGLPTRNVVVFVDDVISDQVVLENEESEAQKRTFAQGLQRLIAQFEGPTGQRIPERLVHVVLTVQTAHYATLATDLKEYFDDFSFIEMKEATLEERKQYIGNVTSELGFHTLDGSQLKLLANASHESLAELYNFFRILQASKKTALDSSDIEQFKQRLKINWREGVYPHLSKDEQMVFDALTKLEQFSIPALEDVVVELCCADIRFFRFLQLKSYRKTLRRLHGRWLTLDESRIYCHESRLALKEPEDASVAQDLQVVADFLTARGTRKKFPKVLYALFKPLGEALHKQHKFEEAIRCDEYMLGLNDQLLSPSPPSARSELWFFKGYNYYSMGRKHWVTAQDCYTKALELNRKNIFAKHALATLLKQEGRRGKALELLDEIIKDNPQDVLTQKTRLELQLGDSTQFAGAVRTYRDIRRLLRNTVFPPALSLSAELACARFTAHRGEILQESTRPKKAERYFERAIRLFSAGFLGH